MKFPDRFLDEVKGRFRLSEYVGRTVPLKRAGREFSALSPFVNEKTPSFFVNDDKAFYHDFASGKHGDIVDWVMHAEGLGFVEAVTRLAEEAGVALPERDARSEEDERIRRRLEVVLRSAQQFYSDGLRASDSTQAYVASRGLSAEDVERFGIGFAAPGNVLLRCFGNPDELIAAGLAVIPDGEREPIDRFRNRLMFPICDAAGRLVSFGARALDPKSRAKYLNGPDTAIFDKGRQLYGLNMARKALSAGAGPLVVVEGYMDVIACLRAGVASCAPMGTSLTSAQLDLLWRFHPEPTLCFDADAAGRRAAARVMDMAIPRIGPNRSLRFSMASGAKDPDQVMREQGADALRRQMLQATPLAEAIFQREVEAAPLDTPERRADLRERLHKIARAIGDRGIGSEYGALFRQKLEAMRQHPAGRAPATAGALDAARALHAAIPPLTSALGYWLVKDPMRAMAVLEDEAVLCHPGVDQLIVEATAWLLSNDPDGEKLAQHLHVCGLGEVVVALADPRDLLKDPETWRQAYRRLDAYRRLEAAVQEAKVAMTTPEQINHFMALKAQRDEAKRAL